MRSNMENSSSYMDKAMDEYFRQLAGNFRGVKINLENSKEKKEEIQKE